MSGKESVNIHLKIYRKQTDVHLYYSVQRKNLRLKEYVSKEQMSVPFLYEGIKKLVSSFSFPK